SSTPAHVASLTVTTRVERRILMLLRPGDTSRASPARGQEGRVGLDGAPRPQLRHVYPIVARLRSRSGLDVVLCSVEVWDGFVVVRDVAQMEKIPYVDAPQHPPRHELPSWQLGDDAGTSYSSKGGGAGVSDLLLGQAVFLPAPPPRATRLFVSNARSPSAPVEV